MAPIKKYPTNRASMPTDMGFKNDPTHQKHIDRVGGIKCPGGRMSNKIKLPIKHSSSDPDGDNDA